jgi:methionine synthase II (cobalamin-independent)
MPGTDVPETMAIVAGEVPDLPFLPELPARGAGADMVGRTAGALLSVAADFALEAVPSGWCVTGQVGPDMRRARSWLGEDLDRLEEALGDSPGYVKVQLCGPWTWAATVEDRAGRRVVRDEGFMADLGSALAHAALAHVAEVSRRLPHRQVVLQIDEPGLPAVVAGSVPTASGWGTWAAVPRPTVADLLAQITAEVPATVLHSCGGRVFDVARMAGFTAVSWDATGRVSAAAAEEAAEAYEAGLALLLGLVSPTRPESDDELIARFRRWWIRTGLSSTVAHDITVTPACGLAGVSPATAREAIDRCAKVRRQLAEWEG